MCAAYGGHTETCVQLHAWGADPNMADWVRIGQRCFFPLPCLTVLYCEYFPVEKILRQSVPQDEVMEQKAHKKPRTAKETAGLNDDPIYC